MAQTTIDTEVFGKALADIARALESLEQSVRAGARMRASDLKIVLDAVNEMQRDVTKTD